MTATTPHDHAGHDHGAHPSEEDEIERYLQVHDAAERRRSEQWRAVLTGADRSLKRMRRLWQNIPSSPRCKVCAAPFTGPGRLLTRVFMHGRTQAHPLLCNLCFSKIKDLPGGAELDISVMFADIRGSTAIAERGGNTRFRELLQRFYRIAARAIDRNGGIVDKFLGDGIMALFVPVVAGADHPRKAIAAARQLLEMAQAPELAAEMMIGVGVHSGEAFVGVIGAEERTDFTAVGDTVNVAARLGSLAGASELLASGAAWDRAGPSTAGAERRSVTVTGRSAPIEVVRLRLKTPAPA